MSIQEPRVQTQLENHAIDTANIARVCLRNLWLGFFFFFLDSENEPNLEISRFCQEMSWPNMQYGRKII